MKNYTTEQIANWRKLEAAALKFNSIGPDEDQIADFVYGAMNEFMDEHDLGISHDEQSDLMMDVGDYGISYISERLSETS